jgi:aryl-alcohol dehydrogenase-like predicted oxidoreductase
MTEPLPTASFGSTGHVSTRVLFGAAALGAMSQDRADATLETVHRWGINHIDTAASYGESEDRLKPWLADHRSEVFLATKTGERDGAAARAELERSLTRMGVDHVDLIQLHNLVEEDEWQVAHGPGGAVEAMTKARDEGLVSHIGVTGHGLRIAGMHLRSLERFPFASVLFPYSHTLMEHPGYRHDVEALLERCVADGVAAQTIKSIARRRWPADSDAKKFSWYEPLDDPDALTRAVQWVLSDERVFLNSSSDARLLEHTLAAAAGELTRPDDSQMAADVTAEGVTPLFDGGALERI